MNQLIESILKWWEDHKYDEYHSGHNVYDEPPEFVQLAMDIKNKMVVSDGN